MGDASAETLHTLAAQAKSAAAKIELTAAVFGEAAAEAEALLAVDGSQDDGEWMYVLLPERGYAVITGHHDRGRTMESIPAVLAGCDVVALLPGVFDGHDALESVTVTGNVYYAAADAFPRGVTLRGYNGSYAESWAAENGHAFENLSEYDFLAGVVDMSDISTSNFVRHSAEHVTLRALEANRLQEGSVFFLADPDNLYATAFYIASSITVRPDGMVDVICETPDIRQVFNSIEMINAPLRVDWDSLVLAEGVSVLSSQSKDASSDKTGSAGLHLTPHLDLGSKGKFTLDIGYSVSSTGSVSYKLFDVDTAQVINTETFSISGKIEYESGDDKTGANASGSAEDHLRKLMDTNARKPASGKTQEASIPLGSLELSSPLGILKLTLDLEFTAEYTGSIELSYKVETSTTYTYKDDALVSKATKNGQSVEAKIESEVKIGLELSLKLKLVGIEFASISGFAGLKGTAAVTKSLLSSNSVNVDIPTLIQGVTNRTLSIAELNMMDCIVINVNLLMEVSAKLGNSWGSIASGKITLINLPVAEFHYHYFPLKFCVTGTSTVFMQSKTLSEKFHEADLCPLMDNVLLMIPSISRKTPMGTVTLYGYSMINSAPELELPEYRVRVAQWYTDEELKNPILKWGHFVESGDRLYGSTEPINALTFVNYKGEVLLKPDGTEAIYYLADDETLDTADIALVNEDHIVGWVEVKSMDDLTFVGSVTQAATMKFTGDGKDHVYLVICDNDLTIYFRDTFGKDLGKLETGHYIEIPNDDKIPPFPVLWDPSYAIATFEWRALKSIFSTPVVTFPFTADHTVGSTMTLYMTPTGIQRVFNTSEESTLLGSQPGAPSGLTTYSAPNYYNYTVYNDHVRINGFRSEQKYEDEAGNTYTWQAVPKSLSIPAYIDDKPVTEIASGAFRNLEELVSVKLPATITTIGGSAFSDCPALVNLDISACSKLTALPDGFARNNAALTGIAIPGSVTSIGAEAFLGCVKLTAADINADIGARAFSGCTSLKSVTLRTRVSAIGAKAFMNCSSLTTLTVPCSVQSVGDSFIEGCTSLTTLTFDGAPATITRGIMRIGENSSLSTLTLELGVTSIGSNAFSDHPNLTTITLPEALTSVGTGALTGTAVEKLTIYDLGMIGTGFAKNCTTLKELTFEKGVISDYAFDGCTHLEKITMGGSVFAIGDYAFRGCTALTSVVIGDGVETIGTAAFRDCTALESITLSDKLTSVGSGAFWNCSVLKELHFPPTVESFGSNILYLCKGLETLSIGGPNTPVVDGKTWFGSLTGNGNYGASSLKTVIFNEGVEEIGDRALTTLSYSTHYGHNQLTTIKLPSTLVKIGDYAFSNCPALTNLTLPASLTHIGIESFLGCTSLTLNCPDDLNLLTIGEYAFRDCTSMDSIKLGNSLKYVGNNAFRNCTALKELHFPPSVQSFGASVLYQCKGLETLSIGGPNTSVVDGKTWFGSLTGNGDYGASSLKTVIFNEGVEEIGDRALTTLSYSTHYGHNQLTTIKLPSTLVKIGDYAFSNCPALTNLTLPASLTHIGIESFLGCTSLTLNCPDDLNLLTIGEYAFAKCSSLTSINWGQKLESIGNGAFRFCDSLKSAILPSSLISVGDFAFAYSEGLEEVHFPPSVEHIGNGVITQCNGLKVLSIGGPNTPVIDGKTWFGEIGTFGDTNLEKVIFNEGVEELAALTLANPHFNPSGHDDLTTVILPSTLVKIGDAAFENCKSLTNVTLPASLKYIGAGAFRDCTSLTVNCPDDLELLSIGESAFYKSSGLKSINLGSSLREVGKYAFLNCTSLEELHFPPSVESFGGGILEGCDGLKVLSIGGPNTPVIDGKTWFGEIGAFGDTNLEKVIFNEGVEELAALTLANPHFDPSGHDDLTSISLPASLKTIGADAFAKCRAVATITLPTGIESISDSAFSGCKALTTLHSPAYSEAIATYAQTKGLTYTYDDASVTLTLMEGDTTLYTGSVTIGASITALLAENIPADHDGTTFDGWCINADGTAPWIPDAAPAFDLTLYACMVPVHTASFAALNGNAMLFAQQFSVGEGHIIPWPEEPALNGYHFCGWFTDAEMTQPLSADAVMGSADVRIYGRMTSASAGAVYVPVEGGLALKRLVLTETDDTDVWLPTSVNGKPVVAIESGAFADALKMTSLHLPDGLTKIGDQVFSQLTELTRITTGPANRHYKAVNGILYTADMGTLICLPQRKPIVTLSVPETVHTIVANACANHVWLQKVELPDSVATLEAGAFSGCRQLTAFSAYGLTSIGAGALPVNQDMLVYGPVRTGVLRKYFLLSDGDVPVFSANYNLYHIFLYLDGKQVSTLGLEAGAVLPGDFLYGEQPDGIVVHTWFTDAEMTAAWNREDPMPAAELSLYAPLTPVYEYETVEFTVDGETVAGIRLTGYNGSGGALVLPTSIDGKPVMSIGSDFLADAQGVVSSVQISSEVIEIADTALAAPEEYPFGKIVRAEEGSYAASWAAEHGYTVNDGVYTLTFEVNEGGSIAARTVSTGTAVKLPTPVKDGCTFLGWFTDAALQTPAELVDGCFTVPAADTVLYAAWEGTPTAWSFTFAENADGITITGCTGSETALVIPETINGKAVTAIADYAFADSALTTLTLPDTMQTIGSSAFAGSSLTSVDLGGTVTVGANAFSGCEELSSVTMTEVKTLAAEAFASCTSLKTLHIPATMESISPTAFNGCTALYAFTAEEGGTLTAVDGVLYSGDTLLRYPPAKKAESFALPGDVTEIAASAFSGASALTELEMNDALQTIGENAFSGCTALTAFSAAAAEQLSAIPDGAFSNCTSLSEVTLGSGVQSIGSNAFANCTGLTQIALPESVESIEPLTFRGIPSSQLTIIGTTGSAGWTYASEQGYAFVDPELEPVTGLKILCETVLYPGTVTELSAELTPSDVVLGGELLWQSSDPDVLYIYGSEAHALALGEAVITVTAPNGVEATLQVKIENPPVRLSAEKLTLSVGQSITLAAEVPEGASAPACTWTSSDAEVILVEGSVLTALAQGTADVQCQTADGSVLTAEIEVLAEMKTLTLPVMLTQIDAEAFYGLNVERIELQEAVTDIGALAFANIPGLKQLILPAVDTLIAPDVLEGCTDVVILCTPGSDAYVFARENELSYAHPVLKEEDAN